MATAWRGPNGPDLAGKGSPESPYRRCPERAVVFLTSGASFASRSRPQFHYPRLSSAVSMLVHGITLRNARLVNDVVSRSRHTCVQERFAALPRPGERRTFVLACDVCARGRLAGGADAERFPCERRG
jgi:hypothetical protein